MLLYTHQILCNFIAIVLAVIITVEIVLFVIKKNGMMRDAGIIFWTLSLPFLVVVVVAVAWVIGVIVVAIAVVTTLVMRRRRICLFYRNNACRQSNILWWFLFLLCQHFSWAQPLSNHVVVWLLTGYEFIAKEEDLLRNNERVLESVSIKNTTVTFTLEHLDARMRGRQETGGWMTEWEWRVRGFVFGQWLASCRTCGSVNNFLW